MGSHTDLLNATSFLSEHRIEPIVSHVLDGLERAEEGFEVVKRGEGVGKVVIRLGGGNGGEGGGEKANL